MSRLFAFDGESIGASATVLPVNIQGLFPLGLTGLICLQSKGPSKSLLQHHNSKASILPLALSLLSGPHLTSLHDY